MKPMQPHPRLNHRISTTEATHNDWDGLCIQSPLYSQHQFTSAQKRVWTISFHDNTWSKQHTAANHRGCKWCNCTLYFTIIYSGLTLHICVCIYTRVSSIDVYICMWLYKTSTLYRPFQAIVIFHTCTLSQLQHDSKRENFKSASVDNSDGVVAVPPEPFKVFTYELN